MVLEKIFSLKSVQKHLEYPLYIGVIYTVLSFATSYILFNKVRHLIGMAAILFIVILAIPLVSRLFTLEEKLELGRKKNFVQRHKVVIDFFVYFFIGVFLTFFVLSLAFPNLVFSEDQLYGRESATQKIVQSKFSNLPPPPAASGTTLTMSIFRNNVFVMVLSFFLSLFYGSGALFLITLNASVFASALAKVIRIHAPATFGFIHKISFLSCNIGVMFFHMIPEVGGYLLAAIAGGVLSKAISREKLFSRNFNKILKSVFLLFIMSIAILYIAAILEVNISQKLFLSNACLTNTLWVLLVALAVIIVVVALEFFRKKK